MIIYPSNTVIVVSNGLAAINADALFVIFY